MTTTVRLDEAAIRNYADSAHAADVLARLGELIAEDARRGAPRDTGAMADSIDYEIDHDAKGAFVKVSWSEERFYGFFVEVGTSSQPARPFLRPAALTRRTL